MPPTADLPELLRDFYAQNHEATIPEASKVLDAPEREIMIVLDSHLVLEDGTIEEVGQGQGGGWVPSVSDNADG